MIEYIIRQAVVWGNDVTLRGVTHQGYTTQAFFAARRRIGAFKLVDSGVSDYQALGWCGDGVIPVKVLREHLVIEGIYAQSAKIKAELNG